jgi:DNA-binding MarR family transcriptional regulator
MSDLADAVVLTRSGLTRLVDRLEQRGLVERRRCPTDARGFLAALTEEGDRRLEEARRTHLAGVRQRFLDKLEPEELEILGGIWQRVGAGAIFQRG